MRAKGPIPMNKVENNEHQHSYSKRRDIDLACKFVELFLERSLVVRFFRCLAGSLSYFRFVTDFHDNTFSKSLFYSCSSKKQVRSKAGTFIYFRHRVLAHSH